MDPSPDADTKWFSLHSDQLFVYNSMKKDGQWNFDGKIHAITVRADGTQRFHVASARDKHKKQANPYLQSYTPSRVSNANNSRKPPGVISKMLQHCSTQRHKWCGWHSALPCAERDWIVLLFAVSYDTKVLCCWYGNLIFKKRRELARVAHELRNERGHICCCECCLRFGPDQSGPPPPEKISRWSEARLSSPAHCCLLRTFIQAS